MRIGAGLSQQPDPRLGGIEAAQVAHAALGAERADLAFVFAAGAHLAAPEATLEGVTESLAPGAVAGCAAGGVLAGGHEVEDGTAVAVWAASFDDGAGATVHHVPVEQVLDDPSMEVPQVAVELPDVEGASGIVLLADPTSFPAEGALVELASRVPGVPIMGALASARGADGEVALFAGDRVVEGGAVLVAFEGVELLPAVSQGAAPVGPELTVTDAEGPLIRELAGVPALDKLREVLDALSPAEQLRLADGMLLGLVVQQGKPDYQPGDFLVRTLLGADPDTGAIAVGAMVEPGQVVRLHARDARTADEDLRAVLELHREALGGRTPAGALLFSCNGRGADRFGLPDHDARAVDDAFGGAPAAGFFAAGEIGPVAGQPFLHAFTATVAVFAP
ncbi:MAG: FIST C-terminal domain-containing protein [Solirubrobacterales bacterium]|nr:FIST C-terminal domain-containing protein [Solirubrobacterales bacterium]